MDIVLGAVGSGKTTELIKRCAEADGQFVCVSRSMCELVGNSEVYKQSGLVDKPITLDMALNSHKEFKPLFIDNLEQCISFMTRSQIDTVSVGFEQDRDSVDVLYKSNPGF